MANPSLHTHKGGFFAETSPIIFLTIFDKTDLPKKHDHKTHSFDKSS